MKKLLFAALAFIAALQANAQSAKDVFNAKEIVWYGLDFSKATFVGQFDQGFGAMPASGYDMKNKWVGQWNALVTREPQNFKLKEALDKESIYYDIAATNTANTKMDAAKCMSPNPGKIDSRDIEEMVKRYSGGDKNEGVGLVFIVENFDKNMEAASVYVTFFDIASRRIYFTEKMSGKTSGAGMRNYWAGAIKSIIKSMDSKYSDWSKRYSK